MNALSEHTLSLVKNYFGVSSKIIGFVVSMIVSIVLTFTTKELELIITWLSAGGILQLGSTIENIKSLKAIK
jgi:hypothetical protein